jgi:hypothetical protein
MGFELQARPSSWRRRWEASGLRISVPPGWHVGCWPGPRRRISSISERETCGSWEKPGNASRDAAPDLPIRSTGVEFLKHREAVSWIFNKSLIIVPGSDKAAPLFCSSPKNLPRLIFDGLRLRLTRSLRRERRSPNSFPRMKRCGGHTRPRRLLGFGTPWSQLTKGGSLYGRGLKILNSISHDICLMPGHQPATP